MKKLALLFLGVAAAFASNAQLTLSGTSYSQDFDDVGNGLPMGWSIWKEASATSLGTDNSSSFVNAATAWNISTNNFRNTASVENFSTYSAGTATLQAAETDRTLAVRQVSATDTGVAFVLQLTNTSGLSDFNLSFKLQSQDSTSPRVTTWLVDYGFGATPSSFTPALATGTLTTGGNTFTNNTVNVNFGNALNNQSGFVWIRIVTLTHTTGTGNRTTTGIDDFNLTWTGSGMPSYRPIITSLTPADNSMNVPVSSNTLMIDFDRTISKGTGNIVVHNQTTGADQTINVSSSDVTVSGNMAMISNVNLATAASYYVTFDSAAFDTAGYKSYGIYDNTTWSFSTEIGTPTSLNETFDAACNAGGLPSGWTKESVTGSQQWNCAGTSGGDRYLQMNGFTTTGNDNEDWLITPGLNLSNQSNVMLYFRGYKGFTGSDLDVLYSTNYAGTGDPNMASWTNFNISFAGATNQWADYSTAITNTGNPLYIAFRYNCSQAGNDCAQWRVDSVVVTGTTGILSVKGNNQMPVAVLGAASANHILVGFEMDKAAVVTASVYDLTGREVYRNTVNAHAGTNRVALTPATLASGMYIIRIANGSEYGVVKAVVE